MLVKGARSSHDAAAAAAAPAKGRPVGPAVNRTSCAQGWVGKGMRGADSRGPAVFICKWLRRHVRSRAELLPSAATRATKAARSICTTGRTNSMTVLRDSSRARARPRTARRFVKQDSSRAARSSHVAAGCCRTSTRSCPSSPAATPAAAPAAAALAAPAARGAGGRAARCGGARRPAAARGGGHARHSSSPSSSLPLTSSSPAPSAAGAPSTTLLTNTPAARASSAAARASSSALSRVSKKASA